MTASLLPTRRLGLVLVLATLSACGGGNHGSNGAAGAGNDTPTGAITDFVGGAFENWGQSEFLGAIGLTPAPATAEQMNEVLSDLAGIQTDLAAAETQLATLLGDFVSLQAQMSQDDFQAQAELLQSITTSEYASWNQFTNIVGNQTLAEVAANPLSTGGLEGLLTDAFLNTLAQQAAELSNTAEAGDELNSTVPDFLTSAKNLLTSEMASAQAAGTNVVPLFDQYNNGLMQQYYYLVNALQQIYTIEQTVLYMQQTTPSFDTVTLAEPGILDSNTYAENYAALDDLFQNRVVQLCTLFSAAIVSDFAPPLTCGTTTAPAPTKAATLPGIVGGPWTGTCFLYEWVGVLPAPETGFEGSWNGKTLEAQCNGSTYELAMPGVCEASSQVSFYAGTNASGTGQGQLQCTSIDPGSVSAPAYDSGAGATFAGSWSNEETNGTFCINVSTFGAAPPNATAISGPFGFNGQWCVNMGKNAGGDISSLWQYTATNGFVGAFAVLGIDPIQRGGYGIAAQVRCRENDPWCSQLGGQSYGSLCTGSSAICLAGQEITLTCSNGDEAIAALTYTGQSCGS